MNTAAFFTERRGRADFDAGVVPRPFDSVVYGSCRSASRLLCGRCFNLEAASRVGLVDFEHVDFSPLTMNDANGLAHVFQLRTRLFGASVAIDAIELNDAPSEGYHFQVIGDAHGRGRRPRHLLGRVRADGGDL